MAAQSFIAPPATTQMPTNEVQGGSIMRRSGIFCGAALLAFVLAPLHAFAAEHTLRLGTVLAPGDPLVVGAQAMKKAVEERTGGKVEVQVFPSSQLGDTQDMMDQAQAGVECRHVRRSIAGFRLRAGVQRARRALCLRQRR